MIARAALRRSESALAVRMHTTMKNFKLFAGIRCSHKKSFEEKSMNKVYGKEKKKSGKKGKSAFHSLL